MCSPTLPAWSHGLLWAASDGDTERLRSLLQQGCSPDTTGGIVCWLRGASEFQKRTPLHYAAKGGHSSCIRLLLLYGADPNCRDEDGYTPIHYVCQFYNPWARGPGKADEVCRCLRHLLDFGADYRTTTNSNYTPMELARRHKNSVCVNELLKQGLTVDPLLITCRRVVCGLIHKEFISPIKDLWIPESLKEYLLFEDMRALWCKQVDEYT